MELSKGTAAVPILSVVIAFDRLGDRQSVRICTGGFSEPLRDVVYGR